MDFMVCINTNISPSVAVCKTDVLGTVNCSKIPERKKNLYVLTENSQYPGK